MAKLTVTIPQELTGDLTKILQAELADEDGDSKLGGSALFSAWVAKEIKPRILSYRKRTRIESLVVAEKSARVAQEAIYATEKAARIAAEKALSDAVDVSVAKI